MIPGGTLWTGRQSLKCSCPVPDAHILEQVTLEQPVRRPLILVSHPDEGVPFLAKRTFSTLFFSFLLLFFEFISSVFISSSIVCIDTYSIGLYSCTGIGSVTSLPSLVTGSTIVRLLISSHEHLGLQCLLPGHLHELH